MGYGIRVGFDPVREIAFGDVSGTYTAVGTPFQQNVRLMSFNNSLDEDVYVSFDGVNNHLRVAMNSFQLFDLSANKIRDDGLFMSVGTQIYVKEVSSSVTGGSFWVEVMYGEGGR